MNENQTISIMNFYKSIFITIQCYFCLLGNAASIFLLTRKELHGFFNQLLAMLCTFDMVYLLTMFLEALRNLGLETPTHLIMFSYFLYPVNAIAMMGSIYMTMVVGLERLVMIV